MATEQSTLDNLSITQEEVNKNGSLNKELIEKEEIKDSPFTIITMDGQSFGVMGGYRITQTGSKKEIKEELNKITWNRIVQVMMILTEMKKETEIEIKEELTNNKNK